ncbi:ubiA [Wigglesworthia glossinidia endosymbiont of Glossina brevipalpis]|uniref:4-hydroxybenzoate polyprenyltransferase n=1 Tax=Wigglesworthia glossinidia brevipalpis TaxID=36870 RepID=Q8D374_WIGBR|nr:ubiA [Wigglesworthia glossinidia endosymbiont of Glossina brevipalpis]
MRLNNLSGFFLLLWPTLWSLWISTNGQPILKHIILFTFAVFFTRTAGCIINDCIDHKIDKKTKRTKNRPLIKKNIDITEAIFIFLIFITLSFFLVILLNNKKSFFISLIALILMCIYPTIKRYSSFPQLFLGVSFSLSILMVYSVTKINFNSTCWFLFFSNLSWTVAYDTQYALADKKDDISNGIYSTATFFKKKINLFVIILQFIMIFMLILVKYKEKLGFFFDFSLLISITIFYIQNNFISSRNTKKFLISFYSNNIIGVIIFLGIILETR